MQLEQINYDVHERVLSSSEADWAGIFYRIKSEVSRYQPAISGDPTLFLN